MKKLCFICQKVITDNNRLAIESITHVGIKFNIKKRLKQFKELITITNNLKYIHLNCYEKIEKELENK